MSVKRIFVICCCLLPLVAACASDNSMSNNDSGDGMLLLGARLDGMNATGGPTGIRYQVSMASVKNLSTGKVYGVTLDDNHGLAQIPAGTYCFNSITPKNGSALVYCGKPYFTLAPHKIMVTGYFVFGVDFANNTQYTLNQAMLDKQGLFNSLSKTEVKTLEDFDSAKD